MSHKLALISTVERYGAWDLSDDNVQGYCCKIAGTDTHEDTEHRYLRKITSTDIHGRYRAWILTEDAEHRYSRKMSYTSIAARRYKRLVYIIYTCISLIIDLKNYAVVLMKRESTN